MTISQKRTGTENSGADIVVIGGGASGLCAAVAAAEAGAENIVVLEKANTTGGNGRVSVGFFAAESPAQRRLGINVSRDEMFLRFMDFNHWKADARLVRAWINKTREIVSWLEEKGVKVIPEVSPFYPGRDSAKWHMLWEGEGKPPGQVGKAIVERLTGECRKLGVRVLLGTAATRILTDRKRRVTGVTAAAGDKDLAINAGGIIIATGGFARNRQLLKKYFPLYNENMHTHSLPQMVGDGLLMAQKAGAAIDKSMALMFFGPHHYAWNGHLTYLHRLPETIRVNKRGERYIGEFTNGSFDSSNALTRQPDGISYTIFDENIMQNIIRKNRPSGPNTEIFASREDWVTIIEEDISQEVENGRIRISGSWDEIAGFIGAEPEVLKTTVEQYNSFCDAGYDADFLKDKAYLWPLRTPPYYAVMSTQGFDVTSGGIKINHRMEVIDRRNDVIRGLYAVGNDAGCVHGGTYTGGAGAPGCDLSFAFCSGVIAGENAARYVLAGGE